MIGPILSLDLPRGQRQRRLENIRRLYAAWLVVQIVFLFPQLSELVDSYLALFVWQHLLVMMLVTPLFVAGAISDEKTSRRLQYLFITDLTSWDIVAGKLLARLAQVVLISLAGMPWLFYFTDRHALGLFLPLVLVLTTLPPMYALGAVSMAASVWSNRTRDAVLRVYLFCTGSFLVWFAFTRYVIPSLAAVNGLRCLDPFHVIEPALWRGDLSGFFRRLLAGALVWGCLGTVALLLAVWRLRPSYQRQSECTHRDARRGATVIVSAGGSVPLPGLRRAGQLLGVIFVVVGTILLAESGLSAGGNYVGDILITFVFSVIVTARGAGSISAEREHMTWDLLLLTPLETPELLWDKLWGVLAGICPYFAGYALTSVGLTLFNGSETVLETLLRLAYAGMILCYMGATGVAWSAIYGRSWQSLLAALAYGFGTCVVIAFLAQILGLISLLMVGLPLQLALGPNPSGRGTVIGVIHFITAGCWMFWMLYRVLRMHLDSAAIWIERWERTCDSRGTMITKEVVDALRREKAREKAGESSLQDIVHADQIPNGR